MVGVCVYVASLAYRLTEYSAKVYNSEQHCVLYFKRNVIHYKSLCFRSILIRISLAKSLMFMFVIAMIMSRLPGYIFRVHFSCRALFSILVHSLVFRFPFSVLLQLLLLTGKKTKEKMRTANQICITFMPVYCTEIRCQFQHWNALRTHTVRLNFLFTELKYKRKPFT